MADYELFSIDAWNAADLNQAEKSSGIFCFTGRICCACVIAPFVLLLRTNMERELDEFLSMYSVHLDLHEIQTKYAELAELAAEYMER